MRPACIKLPKRALVGGMPRPQPPSRTVPTRAGQHGGEQTLPPHPACPSLSAMQTQQQPYITPARGAALFLGLVHVVLEALEAKVVLARGLHESGEQGRAPSATTRSPLGRWSGTTIRGEEICKPARVSRPATARISQIDRAWVPPRVCRAPP